MASLVILRKKTREGQKLGIFYVGSWTIDKQESKSVVKTHRCVRSQKYDHITFLCFCSKTKKVESTVTSEQASNSQARPFQE